MTRFQPDADLNHAIVLAVLRRSPGLDFQSAADAGLAGLPDLAVLKLASELDRILVTHNKRTMPLHYAELIKTFPSAGVLVVPQSMPVAKVADELLLIASATLSEEWVNRIAFLPL